MGEQKGSVVARLEKIKFCTQMLRKIKSWRNIEQHVSFRNTKSGFKNSQDHVCSVENKHRNTWKLV